jgi:hypothetical protein
MGKIFSQVAKPRIPAPSDGIQVNYCKNPKCKNYGRPAKPKVSRGKVAAGKNRKRQRLGYARIALQRMRRIPTHEKQCRHRPRA